MAPLAPVLTGVYRTPGGGGGGTLGILEPLTYTRATSAEFYYPILE